jgi:hypothetical protein
VPWSAHAGPELLPPVPGVPYTEATPCWNPTHPVPGVVCPGMPGDQGRSFPRQFPVGSYPLIRGVGCLRAPMLLGRGQVHPRHHQAVSRVAPGPTPPWQPSKFTGPPAAVLDSGVWLALGEGVLGNLACGRGSSALRAKGGLATNLSPLVSCLTWALPKGDAARLPE